MDVVAPLAKNVYKGITPTMHKMSLKPENSINCHIPSSGLRLVVLIRSEQKLLVR